MHLTNTVLSLSALLSLASARPSGNPSVDDNPSPPKNTTLHNHELNAKLAKLELEVEVDIKNGTLDVELEIEVGELEVEVEAEAEAKNIPAPNAQDIIAYLRKIAEKNAAAEAPKMHGRSVGDFPLPPPKDHAFLNETAPSPPPHGFPEEENATAPPPKMHNRMIKEPPVPKDHALGNQTAPPPPPPPHGFPKEEKNATAPPPKIHGREIEEFPVPKMHSFGNETAPPPPPPPHGVGPEDSSANGAPHALHSRMMESITCSHFHTKLSPTAGETFRAHFAKLDNGTYSIPARKHIIWKIGADRFRVENHTNKDMHGLKYADNEFAAQQFGLICPDNCNGAACWGKDAVWEDKIWNKIYTV